MSRVVIDKKQHPDYYTADGEYIPPVSDNQGPPRRPRPPFAPPGPPRRNVPYVPPARRSRAWWWLIVVALGAIVILYFHLRRPQPKPTILLWDRPFVNVPYDYEPYDPTANKFVPIQSGQGLTQATPTAEPTATPAPTRVPTVEIAWPWPNYTHQWAMLREDIPDASFAEYNGELITISIRPYRDLVWEGGKDKLLCAVAIPTNQTEVINVWVPCWRIR